MTVMMSMYRYGITSYDMSYLLVILGAVLSMIASAGVKNTFHKYTQIRSARNMTGAETARMILDRNGLYDVRIEHISGNLTDHYDPRNQVLRLSDATYNVPSVAAVGVAAHECGHAVQHQQNYLPIRLRNLILPAANFGSRFGLPIFMIGLIFGSLQILMQIGIWFFLAAVLFQLVTLPVELDASRRALIMLESYGILGNDEIHASRKVLRAAAMTYVAAAAASLLNLARLILLSNNGRRRR